jgi:hypothetical protein
VGEARVQGYIDVEERTDDSESAEFETWYDEILVYEDTLILLGYSYRYSGAVIHRYRVRDEGSFERLDAIRLSSGDYFDTSNYATRIVGNQLIFYLPRPLLESSVGIDVHPIVNGEIQAPTGLRAVSWIA